MSAESAVGSTKRRADGDDKGPANPTPPKKQKSTKDAKESNSATEAEPAAAAAKEPLTLIVYGEEDGGHWLGTVPTKDVPEKVREICKSGKFPDDVSGGDYEMVSDFVSKYHPFDGDKSCMRQYIAGPISEVLSFAGWA